MAKKSVFSTSGPSGEVSMNMTPMIDVTFQLIIFFMLSTQITSQKLASLVLHRPVESQARDDEQLNKIPNKILVNVVSRWGREKSAKINPAQAGEMSYYQVGNKRIYLKDPKTGEDNPKAGVELEKAMKDTLDSLKKAGHEQIFLEVRADHRVAWVYTATPMEIAMDLGVEKINSTALLRQKQVK